MMKPKHHHSLSSTYVPPKPRKDCVQKPLFEEEDEPTVPQEPITVTQPEPAPEPIVIIDKKGDEVATVDTPVPIYEEQPVIDKSESCEQCKQPITFRSDDLHPGIVCSKCGHGQNNPNLKGKTW